MKTKNQTSPIHKVTMVFLAICATIYFALSAGNTFPAHAQGRSAAQNDSIAGARTFALTCSYQTNATFEARVIELINVERAKVGLAPLYAQPQLITAAQLHSADMACNNYFSHTGSDGSTVAVRVTRQGYSWSYVGENIAAGYSTPEDVMNGWMNNLGHKANILNVNYTEVGVGYSYWAGSTYDKYWTTDFAASSLPTISGNAGVAGAALSYTDGTVKTAIADRSGNYSISVPNGWTGTITPIRTGFPFTPVSRSYSNIQSNQTARDYTNNWYGSVSITSNRNIVAVGRPHVGSEVASYAGFSAGALTAYVPMLFKNAFDGTYDSALYIQNVDASVNANVTIKYYNSLTGALTCTDTDTITPLASKGYWLPTLSASECLPSGLLAGWVGSVVVTSSTTANVVANGRPHIGGEVMTYDSFSSGSLTSYLPMLFNGAFGGSYNSAFYVQNVDASVNADVTIKYYNSLTGALTCTDTETIAPNTSKGYWLPSLSASECLPAGLPAGWVGGVVVTSTAAPIVTVGRPHIGTQVTTYNGFAGGGLSSYVPMLFRKAYGGTYDSALYVQNVGVVDAAITIKYYKTDGTLTCTDTDTITPLASKGYWLPSFSAAECTGGGLPDDWVGGVVVTSIGSNIVAIGRPHIGAQVTTYNGFSLGNLNSYLPMLFKNMWGTYNSAFYVQNTEAGGPATVTVKFYDVNGNLSCARSDSIPALSTLGYWVPSVTCAP